jgi:glycosyltransferase involved in cell wall biosynthesis
MKQAKISILLPSLAFGGAERVMLNLAQAFAEEGAEVEFVLTKKEGAFLAEAESKFSVIDLKSNRAYKHPFKLLMYVIKNRPNVVISNFWKINLCSCFTRVMFPFFKLLIVEHSPPSETYFIPIKLYSISVSIFYRFASNIIAVSTGVAVDIKKSSIGLSGKIRVIYNAISPNGDSTCDKQSEKQSFLRIISVGRLKNEKNFALLLNAFAIVVQSINAKLMIVGDGELQDSLEQQSIELGVSDLVNFVGFHPNPSELLIKSDLFVLSSNSEGLPTVLIEALYCGLPIVSTDCPHGPREILMDGKYGTLVKVGDERALADAIIQRSKMVNNPDTQRKGAERFLPSKIAEQYLSLIGLK